MRACLAVATGVVLLLLEVWMPLSPHFERFQIVEERAVIDVAAVASETFEGREVVLLMRVDAPESSDLDADAWLYERVESPDGPALVELTDADEDLIERAWTVFEEALGLEEEA